MNEQSIQVEVGAQIAPLQVGMQQAVQAVNQAAGGINQGLGKIQGLAGVIGSAFGTLTAVLGGGAAFKACMNETIKWNGEAMKLARTLGITTEQASVLNLALGDIYSSQEDYIHAAQMMTRQIASGGEGFKKLGISVKDASGHLRPSADLMQEVLDKLNHIKAGTDRNAAGMAIFGRGWGEAAKLLKLNSQVMEEAREKAERLNLVVGPEGVAMTKAYKAAMNDVEDVFSSLKVQIGSAILPALTKLGTWFGDIGPGLALVLGGALKGIATAFYTIKFAIETVITWVMDFAMTTWEALKTTGTIIKKVITGDFQGAIDAAKEGSTKISDIHAESRQITKDGYEQLGKDLVQIWDGIEPKKMAVNDEDQKTFDPDTTPKVSPFDALTKGWDKQKALLISQGKEAEAYGREAELDYWKAKLTSLAKGGEDWTKAQLKIHELETGIEAEAQERRKARLGDDLAAAKEDTSKRLAIAQAYYDEVVSTYGAQHKLAIDGHKRLEEEQARHRDKMRELGQLQAQGQLDAALGSLDAEEQAVRLRTELEEGSAQDELARLQDLENKKFELRREAALAILDTTTEVTKRQEVLNQIEALEREHAQRVAEIRGQGALLAKQQADSFFGPMRSSMEESLEAMFSGMKGWGASIQGVFQGFWKSIDKGLAKMVSDAAMAQVRSLAQFAITKAKELVIHRATEQGKTAATGQSVLARVAAETWGALKSVALAVWQGMKWIAIKGYEAAAGAYSAIASIPYVGPFLAPVMAGAALAAVIGMGSKLASAAGGYDIPAGVNPLVQAHAQEMILPAKYANVIRGMADGQGGAAQGGDSYHVTIQAMDARGVEGVLMANQGALAKVMKTMAKNGRIG